MIDWLKSLLGKRNTENRSTGAAHDFNQLEQFEVFRAERMKRFHPSVSDAFAKLFEADFSDNIKGLHIEIFLDDPAFSFRLFSQGNNDVWADEPAPIKELNDTIDRLWPIVTEDELDEYMIWEDGPKGKPQVALEQPLDNLNIPRIVFPWFNKILSETRGSFPHPITASVHDIALPEEL
ncbi:hypothetical protein [Phaeobacter inhibens]|uniref:hypothetical protein n=1 Tax=Phaeobacter inhibens TaxID=221822 RepID=UPI0021A5090F|nr:hypothetical protein [Phaeobacter inhibens]UWR53212.1 hypothetical protein K4F84_00925 [Phaeobacter inhibens]UWR68773.1 hypothetical protein K4K95_00915 [Phaeobacter inhibens]UWR98057.1 hypothetical protein K4K99_18470 [Phaeobacter inhibens]UWR98058.1 hypothetical protein K4K99_18475 [Phaeobacter inhibens]